MVNGQPDPTRFEAVVGTRLNRLALAAEGPNPQLFVFGEMVATLWMKGRHDAALSLEKLWNRLSEKHSFQLLCAYPMRLFSQQQDWESLLKICAEHSHVLPAERASRMPGRPDRLHNLLLLQQKACALETEIAEHRRLQNVLLEREAELLDCLESAALPMHWVTPGGTILWANKAQLDLLGYTREQYTGRHISEFHAVPFECANILQLINRREDLRAYPATLQCKNGTLRRVHIDSNPFFRKGKIAYTRCFITAAA
jgi:PAS domain S-box-containing protein